VKVLYCVALASLLVGCSIAGEKGERPQADVTQHLDDIFAVRQECIYAWQDMLGEWASATGGIEGTLAETRAGIRDDPNSKISRIVQRVWSKQAAGGGKDWMSVAEQLDSAIREVVTSPALPEECASLTWLQPLLVETPGVFSEGAKEKLLETAPSESREETRIFSKWLLYGILTAEP
jgi:hypothetical protein